MSNYSQTTFFTPKDALPPSDPGKTIFGAAYDVEFGNIATAISSKFDSTSIAAAPVQFNIGTAPLPGITFVGHTGTGLFSNAGGDLGFSANGTQQLIITAASGLLTTANGLTVTGNFTSKKITDNGNVTIAAPASGTALVVTGVSGGTPLILNPATSAGVGLRVADPGGNAVILDLDTTNTEGSVRASGTTATLGLYTAGTLRLSIANTGLVTTNAGLTVSGAAFTSRGILDNATVNALTIGAAGNLTIATPANGTALVVNGFAGARGIQVVSADSASVAAEFLDPGANVTGFRISTTNTQITLQAIGTTTAIVFRVPGAATALTIASTGGLFLPGATGGDQGSGIINATGFSINGVALFAGIPQNSKSAAYTTVLADANKHIYHPSADVTARTWTIDSNANVAYPIGTAITFDNDTSAGVITLAITTDTLVWLPSGTTGSRSIAAGGQATALKVTATRWHLTGVGIT